MTRPATVTPLAPGRRSTGFLRNAGALMFSTMASSALGFLFWIAAARWFAPDAVGHASALVASMTLLAGVSQLNLVSLYARYLPNAGQHTRRLISVGAIASVGMAVTLCAGFAGLGLGRGIVATSAAAWVLFTIAVAANGLHFIIDGVLTPLGRAPLVPTKNVLAAGTRLVILAALSLTAATSSTGFVLFLAWVVPVIAAVVLTGALVLARWAPAHAQARNSEVSTIRPREVAAFASAEYVNGIVANVVAFVPPLLVTHALGSTTGAYFYIPWLMGISVTTLLWNVVTSFVVSASDDPVHARAHLDRAIRLGLAVIVPATIGLLVGAKPLLSLLGPAYAAHGVLPLRLIGASLPFTAVLLCYAAFCVMDKRMWLLAAAQSIGAVVLLAGSWWELAVLGSTAPALAYLVGQALLGLALLPVVVKRYRSLGSTVARPTWATPPAGDGHSRTNLAVSGGVA